MYQTNTRNVDPTLGLTLAPYTYLRRIFSVDTKELIIAVTLTVASQHPCLNVFSVRCEPIVVFHHPFRHANPLYLPSAPPPPRHCRLSSVRRPLRNVSPARTYVLRHYLTVVFRHPLRHISPVCPYWAVIATPTVDRP